jgi:hypothetical protein
MRTPAAFVPAGNATREEVVREFDHLQDEQIALVRAADGLPLQAARVVSPFNSRATYNLYSCLMLLPGHQLRHIEQAEEVWPARGDVPRASRSD